MMGRAATLALALALLAPLAPAEEAQGRAYAGQATSCHLLATFGADPGPSCPRVAQAGVLTPGACEGGTCALVLDALAQADGIDALRKTLEIDATLDGADDGPTLCLAETSLARLSCDAEDAPFAIAVTDGACRTLRLRATLVEAADAGPGLPVRAETRWEACRSGPTLLLF